MPAGSESTGTGAPALPARFRPLGVRMAGWVFGAALLVVGITVWVTFPPDVRESFTLFQRATLIGMFGVGVVLGHALGRCRVDAEEAGLRVVNGYRTHVLSWPQAVAVRLGPGNPWATLDLADGTSLSAMGIQGSDGQRARRQVRELRALIEARAGQEPDDAPGRT
jgi:hypothetical protein